eukprot:365100-Lingulodinium_polyedra.AAC.1
MAAAKGQEVKTSAQFEAAQESHDTQGSGESRDVEAVGDTDDDDDDDAVCASSIAPKAIAAATP